ncbi:MAG TPA: DHH family phosphoesterase [Thermoanaerobaculia bacterium]|nr:DHH family phosphoesterase [Thermoanaerobaculia bacterium]
MPSPLQQLLDLPLAGDLLILTHDNPDPDSISSAAAMQHLLRIKRGVHSVIGYSGVVGRAENRAMVDLLELPIVPLQRIDRNAFAHIALIDAQPETGNHALSADRIPDIVIDHHPLREATRRARFFDVREELGASASLMTLYLREASVEIPESLATALLYGIRSETQDLVREVSDDDIEAFELLFPFANWSLLAQIARPRLDKAYFSQLARAIGALEVGREIAVARLGEVNDPDFVPEIADLIVRMVDMQWGLCTGSVREKLYVSIRTNDPSAEAGELMRRILTGLGSGGGHGMRGGGNVNINSTGRSRAEIELEIASRFAHERGASPGELQYFDKGEPSQ